MYEKPIICLHLIWHVLGPLKTFISAFVRAHLCVPKWGWVYERGREGHFTCCWFIAFLLFFFFLFTLHTVYIFCIHYKKLISSAVMRTEVSSGSGKMFYFENVVASFQARKWPYVMLQWFSDTLISARPLIVITLAFLVWVSTPPW